MITVYIPALTIEIFTTYFTIRVLAYKLPVTLWMIIALVLINFSIVLPAFVTIFAASKVTNKAQLLSNFIGKYSNDCDELCSLLKVNSLISKLSSRPMILSCGFFNIDYTLGLTMFAAVTTYMIIICQFEKDF